MGNKLEGVDGDMNIIERTILALTFGMALGMEIISLPSTILDIKELQTHTNILAHKCQDFQYEMDVLTALQKDQK